MVLIEDRASNKISVLRIRLLARGQGVDINAMNGSCGL